MPVLTAALTGLVFGLGLIIAGMVNPAKILGFLDLAGRWDPSLALVMVGAIGVGVGAFAVAGRRARTYLGAPMPVLARKEFDRRAVLGGLAFGLGWGMAGFCPGPALVALGSGRVKAAVFVAAMLAGMALFEVLERYRLRGDARGRAAATR